MKPGPHPPAAFTLAEIIVSLSITAVVGMVLFTLMYAGATLFNQNVSINQTHSRGLISTEKLLTKVIAAAEAPGLVNDAGATQSGNGSAPGIRYLLPASEQAYAIPAAVSAGSTTFIIFKSPSQPAPQVDDTITMSDLGFRGVITSASGSGNIYSVGFGSSVGSGFSPAKTSGIVVPAASKCFLLIPAAFISVDSILRHYPRAMSVGQHGAAAFNAHTNFDAVATLLPVANQTNSFPFRYLDSARRSIDVNLRVRAPTFGSGIKGFYTFQTMKTTVTHRCVASQ